MEKGITQGDYDRRDNDRDRNPLLRGLVINMIFRGPIMEGTSRNSRKSYTQEVIQIVGEEPKRAKIEIALVFDDSDLEWVKFPHVDPLVISPIIGNFHVK